MLSSDHENKESKPIHQTRLLLNKMSKSIMLESGKRVGVDENLLKRPKRRDSEGRPALTSGYDSIEGGVLRRVTTPAPLMAFKEVKRALNLTKNTS